MSRLDTLRLTVINGDLSYVELLLNNGASINLLKRAILNLAIKCGHLNIVEFLFKNGASINSNNALVIASKFNRLNIVKYLINNSNVNKYNNALLESIMHNNVNIVEYLIKNGATIHDDFIYFFRTSASLSSPEISKIILKLGSIDEIDELLDSDDIFYIRSILSFSEMADYPSLIKAFRNVGTDIYDLIEHEK